MIPAQPAVLDRPGMDFQAERIAGVLDDKPILLMRNHGVMVIGETVARTLDYARAATQDTFSNTDPVVGNTQGDIDSLWVDMEKGEDAFLGRATIGQVPRNNPDK